jgi:hypothetical protein
MLARWMVITLVIVSLLLNTSISHAQTPASNYGCLEVGGFREIVRFDLSTAEYTTLAVAPRNFYRTVSPDNKYTTDLNETGQLEIFTAERQSAKTIALPKSLEFGTYLYWSPNSHYLAIQLRRSPELDELIIVSMDQDEYRYEITNLSSGLSWSPDSRYVAVGVNGARKGKSALYTIDFDLYGIDGTIREGVAKGAVGYLDCRELCYATSPYQWADDGRSLFFMQSTSTTPDHFKLAAYHVEEQRNEILVQDISYFPVYSDNHQHALVEWKIASTIYVGLLNLKTGHMLTLDADDSEVDLKWIGEKVLIRRAPYFIWANADGSAKHRIDVSVAAFLQKPITINFDPFGSGVNYDWSRDGHWLILSTYSAPLPNSPNDLESTMWLVDLITAQVRTFPNMNAPETVTDKRFISEDSRFAVLISFDFKNDLYLLSLDDGKLKKFASGDSEDFYGQIHQLIWSPDNELFGIIYRRRPGLYLMQTNGVLIKRYDNFPPFLEAPYVFKTIWSDCPQKEISDVF